MARKLRHSEPTPIPIGRRALLRLQRRRRRVERFHQLADACSDSDSNSYNDSDSDAEPLSHGRNERQSSEEPVTGPQKSSEELNREPQQMPPVKLRLRVRASQPTNSTGSNSPELDSGESPEVIDLTRNEDYIAPLPSKDPLIETKLASFTEQCTYLPPLSSEDESMLQMAFASRDEDVVVYHRDSKIPIKGSSFKKLKDEVLLDDEIINAFAGMISSRNSKTNTSSTSASPKIPKTYMFSSFFISRLRSRTNKSDYSAMHRWTKRAGIDVTQYDLLLFPIHVNGNHWALCVIDLTFQEFQYLDTLYNQDKEGTVASLKEWLYEEIKSCKGTEVADGLNVAAWNRKTNKYRDRGESGNVLRVIPHQTDSSSCGVLSLKIADCLAMGIPTYFTHSDTSMLRRKIALDILRTYLPTSGCHPPPE